ncbi:MAG: enoyl-CoA hydratase-related protein [Chloroflexi bacterium]|nr:enoyl-CoA hydratase-related protein [Chloroflexota bacterium]
MYEQIILEIEDPVATITLNRPEKLNTLTDRMRQELRHAVATAEASSEVVGIIITGAGRGFSAGADMGELGKIQEAGEIAAGRGPEAVPPSTPGDPALDYDLSGGITYFLQVRKPVIAALNGACAGLGFSMAMFCDLRFASDRASIVPAYAKLGLVAEHGTSWIVPRVVGPARALDLLWRSERIEPQEALALGLIDRVFEHDALLDETKAYLRHLAETVSPTSLMRMKQQIYRHPALTLREAMAETEELMAESVRGPDFQEGIAAFGEKRAAVFRRLELS